MYTKTATAERTSVQRRVYCVQWLSESVLHIHAGVLTCSQAMLKNTGEMSASMTDLWMSEWQLNQLTYKGKLLPVSIKSSNNTVHNSGVNVSNTH
jgi:hypothetical protein